MSSNKQFSYGGQAVMEGVMMRGAHKAAIAVRDPNGDIQIKEEPLSAVLYRGRLPKTPFVRGLIGLWDALGLGTKALMWSANVGLMDGTYYETTLNGQKQWVRYVPERMTIEGDPEKLSESQPAHLVVNTNLPVPLMVRSGAGHEVHSHVTTARYPITKRDVVKGEEEDLSSTATTGIVLFSLVMMVGLFIGVPVLISSGIAELLNIDSNLFKNGIEEVIKVSLFIGYILLIGQMPDVKRLFRYHGAEHKTINAYEAGAELKPEIVNTFPIEHPRCGTAFLLNVIILSIIVNSIIGRPDNFLVLVALRILAIPVVAGIAYEWLRFTAQHVNNPIISVLIKPNLALQRLTTREPDLSMCEVAIKALERVLVAEGLNTATSSEKVEAMSIPAEVV